ncbi:MAG: epimerase [Candidatus Cloacimonetes bacterium HGW-Cloacimonetes-1]|nr:MAG: epimerase [Candidatus Cloacimonetes bacterium HGW-Cloacimonetes-1]
MLKSQRILVTGGAGFIGSHLCDYLLNQGILVYCLDNFCDFYDPAIKHRNIEAAMKNKNFQLINADIRDAEKLHEVFAQYSFDLVVHMAAMAGVRPSIENPALYLDVNIAGTLQLLQACTAHGIKRFVFASSSSIYGNNTKLPFAEDDCVDHPISPYAMSKKAAELLCHNWHHLYKMSIICLRFFTVYGPRQRPDLAIHKFARMIINDQPIPMFGDGSTARDYTYIDDIIQGVSQAISYVEHHHCYEIINLGEAGSITLEKMIKTIENALGKPARINLLPMQSGDVENTFADITKAKSLLNYNPQTSFEAGIQVFIDWIRSSY